jgi:hypothetical protein
MPKLRRIFNGATGLNNVLDPMRIQYNEETGVSELAIAYNVDVDYSGSVDRRDGFTATSITGSVHSLWADHDICLLVENNILYWVNPDYSKNVVRTGMVPNEHLGYTRMGRYVYYSSIFQNGYVKEKVNYTWENSTYVGPPTKKSFSSPPLGRFLDIFAGRMYIGVESYLWYSERFAYSRFNLADNFILHESELRGVKGVTQGIYVGLETGMYFYSGMSPSEFRVKKVSDSPVVEGSMVKVPGIIVGKGDLDGIVLMWTAEDGIYLGSAEGQVVNLTKRKLTYPSSNKGSGLIYKKKYLCLMEG